MCSRVSSGMASNRTPKPPLSVAGWSLPSRGHLDVLGAAPQRPAQRLHLAVALEREGERDAREQRQRPAGDEAAVGREIVDRGGELEPEVIAVRMDALVDRRQARVQVQLAVADLLDQGGEVDVEPGGPPSFVR